MATIQSVFRDLLTLVDALLPEGARRPIPEMLSMGLRWFCTSPAHPGAYVEITMSCEPPNMTQGTWVLDPRPYVSIGIEDRWSVDFAARRRNRWCMLDPERLHLVDLSNRPLATIIGRKDRPCSRQLLIAALRAHLGVDEGGEAIIVGDTVRDMLQDLRDDDH